MTASSRMENTLAKNKKPMKPAPQLPLEMLSWPKPQLHLALLNILAHDIGSAVRSDLLKQQLVACRAGLQEAKDNIAEIENNELATQYQQIYDEEISGANAILEDHVLVFFVACQLYITRVVEAVRWFTSLESGRSTGGQTEQPPKKFFVPKSDIYDSSPQLRHFGTAIVKDMTIAECMWHLGNYAKHNDELEAFSRETKPGLESLGVCNSDGSVTPNAIRRGLHSVTGQGVDSIEDIGNRLDHIASSLKVWAEQLEARIIADLDDYFLADPTYTKRLNDGFRRIFVANETAGRGG